MKLGIVGPSYQSRSLPLDAQRTVNLFPVIDETGQGKEVAALFGVPGKTLFATAGAGPIRGEFASTNGRAFVVSDTGLYEISSAGVATLRGTLTSDTTICTIDENPTQLAICDETDLWIFTYGTNAFAKVTDGDFPGGGTVTFLDGYFIVNDPSTGKFYISAINDGTSWDGLDFATAEGSPDNLVRVFGMSGLWLFGERTTEVWYNSGDVDFPFSRIEGAKIEAGCAAAHSVAKLDNTVFWLGQDKDGTGIVYRASGYTPQRISTNAIEKLIAQATNKSQIRAYTYQQEGHAFYCLTGGGLATSLCYDVSTQQWHERAELASGAYAPDKASTSMFAFGKNLVGDKASGNIYQLSLDVYADASDPLRRERIFTHIFDEGKRFRMNELVVEFERGVGLNSGQGSAPVAWLSVSEDGGRTWSPEYETSIGAMGKYAPRAVWRRLGMAETSGQVTFKIAWSDPVKSVVMGAYLR